MRSLDLFNLIILAAIWGSSFLFTRIAAPILGPVWLIEIRVLLASLVLLPWLWKLNLINELKQKIVPLFIVGCFNLAAPFLLFAFASLYLSSGFAAILNATTPLVGTVIAFVWLKEKLTFSRLLGLAIGFAGVVILVGWDRMLTSSSEFLAIAAGLLASAMYAVTGIYIKLYLSNVSPLTFAIGGQLSAAIAILPLVPFTIPLTFPNQAAIISTIALALLATSLAYILYFRSIKNIGPTKTFTVTYLIPIFAMLLGAIALDEEITRSMIFGCSLILFGTAIVFIRSSSKT
jgi:drug/metabolite transporter (DMT)-like permease